MKGQLHIKRIHKKNRLINTLWHCFVIHLNHCRTNSVQSLTEIVRLRFSSALLRITRNIKQKKTLAENNYFQVATVFLWWNFHQDRISSTQRTLTVLYLNAQFYFSLQLHLLSFAQDIISDTSLELMCSKEFLTIYPDISLSLNTAIQSVK